MQVLEKIVFEKDENIREISSELKRTQKSLKMLNSGLVKLDQILFDGKSVVEYKGLDFKGEYSNSKPILDKPDPVSISITSLSVTTKVKFEIESIVTKNIANTVTSKLKPMVFSHRLSNVMSGVTLGLGSGAPNATKGKLTVQHAATRSVMKYVTIDQKLTAHFHRFMKFVMTDLEPAVHSHFVSTGGF